MKLFSIFDRATEAHSAPFAQPSAAAAMRAIRNEMRNQDSQLAQHPQDFDLVQVGEFNEETGAIVGQLERVARIADLVEVK